jgi:hypothetical protein
MLEEMPTPKLTNAIVEAAIFGFEEQKKKIDAQIAELRNLFSGKPSEPNAEPVTGRRHMSAAARKKIAAAQRKRWAEAKSKTEAPAKPKRKLSEAGKAAIIAATKKRWAAKRAAEKK